MTFLRLRELSCSRWFESVVEPVQQLLHAMRKHLRPQVGAVTEEGDLQRGLDNQGHPVKLARRTEGEEHEEEDERENVVQKGSGDDGLPKVLV